MSKNYIEIPYNEAYIKYKKQLIIVVSGLAGCGKSILADNIKRDFKLKLLDQHNYYKKDYQDKVTLKNNEEVVNWDNDNAFDWKKFNKDVNKHKETGVIIDTIGLPYDKIDFEPDFNIYLSITKKKCIEKRKDFLEKHKETYKKEYEEMDTTTSKLKFNTLTYPYYLENMKKAKGKISNFIQGDELTNDEIYDVAFDYIIKQIGNYLYKGRFKSSDSETTNLSTSSDLINTDSIGNTTDTSTLKNNTPETPKEITPPDETPQETPKESTQETPQRTSQQETPEEITPPDNTSQELPKESTQETPLRTSQQEETTMEETNTEESDTEETITEGLVYSYDL